MSPCILRETNALVCSRYIGILKSICPSKLFNIVVCICCSSVGRCCDQILICAWWPFHCIHLHNVHLLCSALYVPGELHFRADLWPRGVWLFALSPTSLSNGKPFLSTNIFWTHPIFFANKYFTKIYLKHFHMKEYYTHSPRYNIYIFLFKKMSWVFIIKIWEKCGTIVWGFENNWESKWHILQKN